MCRLVRGRLEKGCQVITWYLVDDTGHRHKAAQGEATRKSPFQYSACPPFALQTPMPYCTNQQQVLQWLKKFAEPGAPFVMDPVEGGAPAGGPGAASRAYSPPGAQSRHVGIQQLPLSPGNVAAVPPEVLRNPTGKNMNVENPQHAGAGVNSHYE